MLVQELMLGQALDKQLYVEGWRPDRAEQLQAALDVASGMNYLHTFSQCANPPLPFSLHRHSLSDVVFILQALGAGFAGAEAKWFVVLTGQRTAATSPSSTATSRARTCS